MSFFSIIIPLYNKEKTISRAIESVLVQSFVDFELIVVDDGSKDNSNNIVKSFCDKRIFLFSKKNGGVSSARNYGIEHSDGEWIVFLDADDFLLPDALSTFYNMTMQSESGFVTANFYRDYNGDRRLYSSLNSCVINEPFYLWYKRMFCPRAGASAIRRNLIGKQRFREDLSRFEDVEFLFKIMRHRSIIYTELPTMVYTDDNRGLSKACSIPNKDYVFQMSFKEASDIWEKLCLCDILVNGLHSYRKFTFVLLTKYWKYVYLIPLRKLL